MRKEWTIISVLLLALVADILWIANDPELNFNTFLQIGFAVLIIGSIYLIGRKYFSRHRGWQLKF